MRMTDRDDPLWIAAVGNAHQMEVQTGRRHYVVYRVEQARRGDEGPFYVTESMPLLGEWYTADGHRHG